MKVRNLTFIALFAALMAICSWISIPFTIPFTLQTFAVFLAVGLLGGQRGTIAVLVYILLGAVGAPVFSGFRGGVGVLLGNTGGYIIGFLASAFVVWGITRFFGKSAVALGISMLIGIAVCYAFGTAWFMVVYTKANGAVPLATVLSWCVVPYIIPDLIKITLAVTLSVRLRRYVAV
ncbi:MAG: biotin transporter BioY [Eubacteriales bacterium]